MIREWIVAAQREFESVLALGRAVAGAGVAADFGKGRHHVADKTHRIVGRETADRHRDRHRLAGVGESQFALAIGLRANHAIDGNINKIERLLERD